MSIGPARRSVSVTARAQPAAVPRSAATYSRPTAANSSAVRDTITTRAPAADSNSAASRPIPRPPPVTSATRPFMLFLPQSGSGDHPIPGPRKHQGLLGSRAELAAVAVTSAAGGVPAAIDRHAPGIGTRARAPVVGLHRDVLDEVSCIRQLEARRNGLTTALQQSQPPAELSTNHLNFPRVRCSRDALIKPRLIFW